MQKQVLATVEGKTTISWLPEYRCLLDEWTNYFITVEEFRDQVLLPPAVFAQARGGVARIIDSSRAKNVFPDDVQKFIGSTAFGLLMKHGLSTFISIRSTVSTTANLGIKRYEAQAGPAGITLVTVASLADALAYVRETLLRQPAA